MTVPIFVFYGSLRCILPVPQTFCSKLWLTTENKTRYKDYSASTLEVHEPGSKFSYAIISDQTILKYAINTFGHCTCV
jgi:hypothetical protein